MSTFNKYRLKGAYHYDWYNNQSWYKKCVDKIVGFCKGSTLDLGCGEGLVLEKIKEKGHAVTGIDFDPHALALVRNQIDVRQADINSLTLSEIWDYMVCFNVIEHLTNPQKVADIFDKNIRKAGIILTLEYGGGSLGEDHKHEYSVEELVEMFKAYKPKPFRIEGIWIGVEIRK